jgi:ligand-binding sensor domain-containing protein
MFNKIFIGLLLILPFTISSQTVVDSMSYGDNTIEWKIFDSEGPAVAFAVSATQVWYSTGQAVGMWDRKKNKKRAFPKLGESVAEGVITIALDNRGGVWFGGNFGVILFKNNKYISYRADNGLADNAVNKIAYASGAIWVATQNGISRNRGGTWKSFSKSDGVCGDKVRDIASDDKGTVYFATDKGIAVFNGSSWKKYDMNSGLSSNDVKAVAYDTRKGVLWAAVGEQDVNNLEGKEWNTFMDIRPEITCIMADTQSRIWFGSTSGILKYNGFEWVADPAKIGFPAAVVTQMYRDAKGDLYFALETGVLHMTNPYPF